mgnify:CR=1 FL=1
MSVASESIEPPVPHPPSDRKSLASLRDGDLLEAWHRDRYAPALEALVERYSVMVLSVCRRRCRTESDAEDAYQTTFLYLASNGRKIRRAECLAGWLQRVAQRAAVATLKSRKRETEPMVEPPADPDDPLDRLTQRHEAIVLDEELSELPEHYRAALVMHCYEDWSLQGLADHFGTTLGTIRGRLQRGKQMLSQRLRRRGVVPVVAFAAANAWTVSSARAAQSTDQFIDATADGLPDPPIDPTLLESLLANGVRIMPSLYTASGLIAAAALITPMMFGSGSQAQSGREQAVVSLPGVKDSGVMNTLGQFEAKAVAGAPVKDEGKASDTGMDDMGMGIDMAGGGMEMGMGGGMGGMGGMGGGMGVVSGGAWSHKAMAPTPTGPIARKVISKLDSEMSLNVTTKLAELPQEMSKALQMPVLLDDRGVAFASAKGDEAIEFQGTQPLRTALRMMLQPLGLKAVVEEEGLVITADPAVLVHQGLGVNRWINIEKDAEQAIAKALDGSVQVDFVELPLDEAVEVFRQSHQLPLVIDRRALEEIGLSSDQPVSFRGKDISLRSALDLLLSELDLTYTIQGEMLVITTEEAAENSLVSRIYWLEGTGLAETDFQNVIDVIQTTTHPDTWEALGGPSTMAPLNSVRPAMIVSTTYTIHHAIERFFEALRETHFGSEPVLKQVPAPASPQTGSMMGGMGGGGMM